MDFNDARVLDAICYDLVLGEYPRSQNRTLIQNLCNGWPPYTEKEVEDNGIVVNVNDLSHTRLMHDGRSQFTNAFMKTGNFFRASTDWGPVHNRARYGAIVTKEANRPLRQSNQAAAYFERQKAKFGMLVLHGISAGVWEKEDDVIARPVGVEDVLIPSGTLLGFQNLPFFVLRRSFTGRELQNLTTPEKRDPGWNMGLVKKVLEWLDEQTMQLRSTNWPETWAPEKTSERVKEDGGYFMGDQCPVVDTFDIYGYCTKGKHAGWVRRIILDSWGEPVQSGGGYTMERQKMSRGLDEANSFLYTSRTRKVYDSWQNAIAFQFADLSAVFPARYHSVRSLGWLTYSTCHIGNRMRCKFYEAVFEALMQMFKVKSMDDAQRALKVMLANKGFIDDTIVPVPAAERWQVPYQLVEAALQDNQQMIDRNSSAWVQVPQQARQPEKTRFQYMAELQQLSQLTSAALNQAYVYEVFEDREMFRRLCKRNSTDPMSRKFRENCLKQGVPEKLLNNPDAWEIEHERVMGGGNKTQELQVAQWLMEQREKFDPEPQRRILHSSVLAVTDDASRADDLVPERPVISESIHDTELAFGALMMGGQVSVKGGLNAVEVCARMLQLMQGKVQEITQIEQGVGTVQEVIGLGRCAQYIQGYLQILAQNKAAQQLARAIGDAMGKIMNLVKAMAQRQAEQAKAGRQGDGGMDPKDLAKIQAMILQAQTKARLATESHAARTAQKQITWEKEEQRRQQEHEQGMAERRQEMQLSAAAKDLETAANIRHDRTRAFEDIRQSRARMTFGNGEDFE
jgi:hypothetical protein